LKYPEHFIPAFKPAKEFIVAVKESKHELIEHKEVDLVEHG
jgi:DNA-binding protein HU-beta